MRFSFAILTLMFFSLVYTDEAHAYDVWAWLSARTAGKQAPVVSSSEGDFRVETVVEGLEGPWGMAFTPDGRILITEKPGRLRVLSEDTQDLGLIQGAPAVDAANQGGLLHVTLHPDFARTGWVYLTSSVRTDGGTMAQVTRHKLEGDRLSEAKIIFRGQPVDNGKNKHYGCRARFAPDGTLYITQGERGEGERAQDLTDLNGKTLRLNEDGSIPEDNPFVGRADARPEIFSYGNRNSQGMAFQPGSGACFQTEHGPSWNDAPGGGDEVNIIRAGANYGWPVIHHREEKAGMVSPLLEYTPAIAPAGACFYTGDLFPEWRNDFFFANLVGRKLVRVKLDGEKVVEQEFLLEDEYGRLRDVATGPDGALYVLTSETDAYGPGRAGGDRLLRIVPAR